MDRTAQLTARPTKREVAYDPPAAPAATASLHVRAAEVLEANWTGGSTVPSRNLYPHQWSWDSAFIAIGLRHLSPLRAQTELETLLAAQWADGRVPHIVFHPSVPLDAYFPSPDFWRSSTAGRSAGAPRTVQTSGIVQPPVHALAAWLVHRADPGLSVARGFLARVYPRLAAWHRYLLHRRDLGGGGLASVVHPWEQGMDNSPCWDVPLARITPAPARSFRRADLDHGAAEDRPTDLDYGRYVRLAADYRDAGYADGEAEFAVEDPAFNALLIASEHALARIAEELGATGSARRARAERLTAALVERLWDEKSGMFLCRDLRGATSTGAPDPERGTPAPGHAPERGTPGTGHGPERGTCGSGLASGPGTPAPDQAPERGTPGTGPCTAGADRSPEDATPGPAATPQPGAPDRTPEPRSPGPGIAPERGTPRTGSAPGPCTAGAGRSAEDGTPRPGTARQPGASDQTSEPRSPGPGLAPERGTHGPEPTPERATPGPSQAPEPRSSGPGPGPSTPRPRSTIPGLIPERSVSGLVPLLLPGLPRDIVDALVRTVSGPHFSVGDRTRLVPSYDLLGEAFDPHRYWRGPAWFNTSWLLERGLRTHGERERADALREAVLELAGTTGFAEYVDPYTGEACGATGFSWTAALALDLLHQRPTPHERQELDKSPQSGAPPTDTAPFDRSDRGGDRG
ncbi:MGH1-like glycoside hydrolase domain-containing protein [Streptomyces sp. NPDC088760]|uniref:MGH1-like glycoside hydrolase domain-containing protein n=1 Tax=Streptomyces sp. NPDC088760 TaxID=3365890 RepID=UPI00381A71AF